MGITGLLPFLKSIQRDVHVSSFKGKKVAVDAYCWLHKGAYSCAMQLVMKTEKLESLPFIRYCMKRVNLLRQYDITPVIVFDGGYLPTKARVEKDRREKRDAYLQKGKALLKEGKKSEAVDCFQKCVDVSPEMALAFIKECRRIGIECIVAPYEADAQLAYLCKEDIVDLVITEDSDLLVFGCQRVLFKMDDSGNGKLVELRDLGKANKSLIGFTQDSFRQMCILSGCDYLSSVPGVGLGKALKFMRKFNQNPYKVIKCLQYETGKVPKDYEDNFRKAEYTFLYQLVFNPRTQTQVRLNDLPDDVDPKDFEFAGIESSPRKAIHMARGNVNPITHEVMDTFSPSKAPPPKSTSWSASAMGSAGRPLPLVGTQTTITLSSTESSRRQFRPPKRRHLAPAEDASLKDEELQAMYLNSTISEEPWHPDITSPANRDVSPAGRLGRAKTGSSLSPCQKPTVVSRFFATKTLDESTPSDLEPSQQRVAVRKLKLLSEETEDSGLGSQTSSMDVSNSVEDPVACEPLSEPLSESIPESPVVHVPPSHHSPDTHNPARKWLKFTSTLEHNFGFSKAKKRKLEQCEPSHNEPTTTTTSLPMEPDTAEPSQSMESQSPNESGSEFEGSSEHSHAQLIETSSYMSSEDFITTAASLENSDCSQHTSELLDTQCNSSQDREVGESLEPNAVKVVDLMEDTAEGRSTSRFGQPSMLLSRITSRSSEKRKKGLKVGLQKPGSRSNFKVPRSSTPGMKQSSLASFMYSRRPQMK